MRLTRLPTAFCLVLCFQFSCTLVREFVGFTALVRLFKDAATGESIVELQCMHARGRHEFFRLFNEIADALAAASLLDGSSTPPRIGRAIKNAPPSSPMPEVDYDAGNMMSLIAMLQSEYADVRQDAIAIVARLVDEASPIAAAQLITAGVLDALRTAQTMTGAADFEAKINCESAVAKLSQHATDEVASTVATDQ